MAYKPAFEILVTPTSFALHEPRLKTELEAHTGRVVYNESGQPLSEAKLLSLVEEVDGIIAGLDPYTRRVLEAAPRLKVIARYGVGVDNVDLKSAAERNVIVTNTPQANSQSVAELTLTLMLSLLRHIDQAVLETRRGEWPRLAGTSLEGKTVGLVGLGAIGQAVAMLLRPFGCRVIATDPYVEPDHLAGTEIELVPLHQLARESDILSLHCPLTEHTRCIVNDELLGLMKPTAIMINTARGELVDESDLVEALLHGRIAGAGLDVLSEQPPAVSNELLAMKRVLVTPHIGAHTDVAANKMGWMAVEDCLAVLHGRSPHFPVRLGGDGQVGNA